MRRLNSRRSDWGSIAACKLFCTFVPRHRDCADNKRSNGRTEVTYKQNSTPQEIRIRFAIYCILFWLCNSQFHPNPTGLLHWQWANRMTVHVPLKQSWRICMNISHGSTTSNDINKQKQSITTSSVYSMAYCIYSRIILCMRPANERRRYSVTSSLIGWVHIQNDPCVLHNKCGEQKHRI